MRGERGNRSYSLDSICTFSLLTTTSLSQSKELKCLIQDDGCFWLSTSESWKGPFKLRLESTFWDGNRLKTRLFGNQNQPFIKRLTALKMCVPTFPPKENTSLPYASNLHGSHAPRQQLCSKRSLSEKQRGFVWIRDLSFKGQGSKAPILEKLTDQFCLTPELWILITTFRRFWGVKPPLNKTITKSAIQ